MPLPLDESISPGQSGHRTDHQVIADVLNGVAAAGDGDVVTWDDASGVLAPTSRASLAADAAFTGAFVPGGIAPAPSGGDDTAAVQAVIDGLAPGGWLFFPVGDYLLTQLVIDKPLRISGMGADTRLIAHSTATDYLLYVQGAVGMEQGDSDFAYGVTISDLFLDGDERGVAAGGIRFRDAQRCSLSNVFIQNFQKSGVYFQRRVRNCFFERVFIKHCGDLDNGYAHWQALDTGSGDGHNNCYFVNCESIYPFGVHVLAKSTNPNSPIRQFFFVNCMFHGTAAGTVNPSYGVNYTADYRSLGTVLWQENARNFFFQNCRMQLPAPGWPSILMRAASGGGEMNAVSVSDCSWGLTGDYEATFTAATDDVLTFGAAHNLATGALVRVASTTTLPAGLSAGTDYYAIRVSSTTIKLATTRVLADAGTAVDITDTGTGTHTLTAQECHVLVESGTFISGDGHSYEGSLNRAHVLDKVGTAKVSDRVSAGSTLYEGTSPNGGATTVRVRKAADETVNNSATSQNDNELTFAIGPGEEWVGEVVLFVSGDGTADFRAALSVPPGASALYANHGPRLADTIVIADPYATSGDLSNMGAATTGALHVIRFSVVNGSTAGSVTLQWAQRTATVADTTLKAGSYIEARRV